MTGLTNHQQPLLGAYWQILTIYSWGVAFWALVASQGSPGTSWRLCSQVITDDVMLVLRGETRGAPTLHWQGAWCHKRAIEGDWPNTDDGREQRLEAPKFFNAAWGLMVDVEGLLWRMDKLMHWPQVVAMCTWNNIISSTNRSFDIMWLAW